MPTQINRRQLLGWRRTASAAAVPLGVVVLCFLVALVATWPLVLHLGTAVPLGTERAATVPLFSLWNLWWTGDRIGHGLHGYWDAPFFYPNEGVTTYSEPMPLLGVLAAPVWLVDAPPALVYNAGLLLVLTLNGICAYRLARVLAIPVHVALFAGTIAVTLPFVAKVLGVLPNVPIFGIFMSLEGLVRFGRSGSVAAAAWASAGVLAVYLTFQQYALFFAPLALAGAIVALSERRFRSRDLLRLGGCGLLAALLIFVLARPAMETRERAGFERPEAVVKALSARPGDFFTRPEHAVLSAPSRGTADTAGLFPGIVLLGLAVGGLASARGRRRCRWHVYLAAGALTSFLLALGLNLSLAGWRPFATLRDVIPFYAQVRSPYRAAAVFQAFLVPLAALALKDIRRVPLRGAGVLVIILGVVAAAENLSVRAPLLRLPRDPGTTATAWLRSAPEDTVVAHVPFPAGLDVRDYEIEAWRLFRQIDHQKPIVNGYSGYFPQARAPTGEVVPTYTLFQVAMAREFPSHRLLCVLGESLGANVLAVDHSWLERHERAVAPFNAFLSPAYEDRDVRMYALRVPPSECRTN